MIKPPDVEDRPQSFGEEIANSISHGAGFLAASIGTPFLIIAAVQRGSTAGIVGASIFAATMLLLYLTSTLYHALPNRVGPVFKILDHDAIFLLIAGTYTPFTLGALHGPWGWTLFGLVWGLACAGIVLKSVGWTGYPILSTCLYISMGWLILIAIKPFLLHVPTQGMLWLLTGGIAYTAGIVFFAADKRVRYSHFIWHLFVIAGTTCHFFAVLWYSG